MYSKQLAALPAARSTHVCAAMQISTEQCLVAGACAGGICDAAAPTAMCEAVIVQARHAEQAIVCIMAHRPEARLQLRQRQVSQCYVSYVGTP